MENPTRVPYAFSLLGVCGVIEKKCQTGDSMNGGILVDSIYLQHQRIGSMCYHCVNGRWSMLVVAGSLIFSAFRRAGATGLRCEQPDSFVLGS